MLTHKRAVGCRMCCCTTLFLLIVIPCVIFAFSIVFAAIFWALECNHAGTTEQACNLYDWFLYVSGNMAGIASPLTALQPASGHVVAEMVDLIHNIWWLAIVGSIVGLMSGLTAIHAVTDTANKFIARVSSADKDTAKALDKVKGELHSRKLTFQAFVDLLEKTGHSMSSKMMQEQWDKIDSNCNGFIEAHEVDLFMAGLTIDSGGGLTTVPEELEVDKTLDKLDSLAAEFAKLEGLVRAQQKSYESEMHSQQNLLARLATTIERMDARVDKLVMSMETIEAREANVTRRVLRKGKRTPGIERSESAGPPRLLSTDSE